MTATVQRATRASSAGQLNQFAGYPMMIRLLFRRNWLRMLIWTVSLAALVPVVIQSQHATFPTEASRVAYANIANTPAVAALTGLPYAASTLGGILIIKIWMTIAVTLSFVAIFLVTRNGRAEEEAGRSELLRAGVLGQHAYSLANWMMTAVFTVVVGIACAAGAIAMGLPAEGSLVMGASYTGVALVFLGVSAVTGQLAETSRGANALASTVLGIAYLVRAGADLAAENDVQGPWGWASPIGWGQQLRAYGENRWFPLLICVAAAVILCSIALAIESRRDLGSAIIPDRPGHRTANKLMLSPVGLTFRLQRAPLIGWSVAVVVGAVFFGAVSKAMADLIGNQAQLTKALGPLSSNVLDALLGFFLMANALIVAAYVLQSADTIRAEEANGSTELQWAGVLSRTRWAGARMLVPATVSLVMLAVGGAAIGASYGATVNDPSQVWRFAGASIAYWPTMLLVIAVVVGCAAWIPRAASAVAWAFYSLCLLVAMMGGLLSLPDWLLNNTPFTAVPRVGATEFSVTPLLILGAIAIVIGAAGLARLRSRDMSNA